MNFLIPDAFQPINRELGGTTVSKDMRIYVSGFFAVSGFLGNCKMFSAPSAPYFDSYWKQLFVAPILTESKFSGYHVPAPKPIEVYYQFIRPFDYLVWLACIVVIVLLFLGFLLLIKTFGKWKGYKLTNFDGVYGIFVNGSKSGALMEITWLFTIFFLITYYKTELLAHLTSTGYDKPPQNIYGKNISCIRQGVSKDTYLGNKALVNLLTLFLTAKNM